MTYDPQFERNDDDFFDDELGDSYEGDDDDDASETVSCPHCGAEIYEDSERCPQCGEYVTSDTSAWSGRPIWWIVLGLMGVAAVILAFTRL